MRVGPFIIVRRYNYSAITGCDEFGDVRYVIAIGRLLPPPAAMERQAEALTGATVDPLPEWYPRRDPTYLMAYGTRIATEADFPPEPRGRGVPLAQPARASWCSSSSGPVA